MIFSAYVPPGLVSVGFSFAFAFSIVVTTTAPNHAVDVRAASCFAVAGKVTCIDAGYVPVAPIAPVVTAPIGPNFDGEDEDIVIRDDGGREVASG